ncbi:MAG: hypothetical protein HOK38_01095 [Flavobacteriaceae bacterium]|nr:hypothetical protein [Flavobacteriaceae bacterium]
MKRIAICLYGLSNGLNTKGHQISFIDSLKKLVFHLENQNIIFDFFYHTWQNENSNIDQLEQKLNQLLKPKNFLIEQVKTFDSEKDLNNLKSRWYSNDKSINLAISYAKNKKIDYDYLLVSRFDCYFKSFFNFNKLKKDSVYVSNWIYPYNQVGCLDYWILMDFRYSFNFSKISDLLNQNFLVQNFNSSHNILKSITNNYNRLYLMREHKDFILFSRVYKKQKLHFRIRIILKFLFNKYFKKHNNIWE